MAGKPKLMKAIRHGSDPDAHAVRHEVRAMLNSTLLEATRFVSQQTDLNMLDARNVTRQILKDLADDVTKEADGESLAESLDLTIKELISLKERLES